MAEPMTLLDLDAAGLDPTQPAPPEFIQFLYDSSRSGYLTLWSAILAQPDGGSKISRWVNDALAVYYARSLQMQMAPPGDKPAGEGVTEVTYAGPTAPPAPVCIDVPAITGVGAVDQVLSCTTGNWGNEPVSYAHAWSSGGTEASYTVLAADAGTSITCVVSATNAGGTTAAPPSNAVLISGATRAVPEAEAAPASRREYPKEEVKDEVKEEEPKTEAHHRNATHPRR